MQFLRQIAVITIMNLRAIGGRLGASLVIVVGMMAVVAVTLSMLSMSTGLMHLVTNSAASDRVIVLSHDSRFEGPSNLARDAVQAILDAPGIMRDAEGKPLATTDLIAYIPGVKKSDGMDMFVPLRGVSGGFFELRPEIHLVEGRMFKPALHELIVGKQLRDQFEGYTLGSDVSLTDGDWKVVGVFDSDAFWSSSLLADAETMLSAFRRNAFNSVTVRIADGEPAFDAFKTALTTNPALIVDVTSEKTYFMRIWGDGITLLTAIAYGVGGIMGLGAIFGALNTMYSAVGNRAREIATLRAIGFGAAPVVVSIMCEALLLAFIGAAIGALIAWFAFHGQTHLMGNLGLPLLITPRSIAGGIALALGIGLIGALFPAIRAARLPVATALQVR